MDYDELVTKVIELLQGEKRVLCRTLKRRFHVDGHYIEHWNIDLIMTQRLASDKNDRILVWLGEPGSAENPSPTPTPLTPEPVAASATDQARAPLSCTPKYLAEKILTCRSALERERKQATVIWIPRLQDTWNASLAALPQALSLVPDAFASAWCLRLLGYAYLVQGELAEARATLTYLQGAPVLSDAMQTRYDVARAHRDLAALTHTHNNQDTATPHLSTALAWFMQLQVPKWVEKTGYFARAYGVTLTEVALEALMDGAV